MAGTVLVLSALAASGQQAGVTLSLNEHTVRAEIANTEAARMQGLAYRRALPEDSGMLFVFPEPALYSMWMHNTHMALSVAFLDERGVIINIEGMLPDTLVRYSADLPAKYALEMNHGWFAIHGAEPGMLVEGIEQAPPAR